MHRTALFWLALLVLLSGACSRRGGPRAVTAGYVLMGTEVRIVAWDPALPEEEVERAVRKAFDRMAELESVLSRHREGAELSFLNREAGTGPYEVGPELAFVLHLAWDAWKKSGGAFDPTVGPLIGLWIRGAKEDRLPSTKEIDRARSRVGFGRVGIQALEDGSASVELPEGFSLDLGGIAKGYIVDAGIIALKGAGVTNGLVEAGGDLACFGRRVDGAPWRVGVQDPASGPKTKPLFVRILHVTGRGVTTSGHYRRYSTIEGKRYSHILDPRTGRPVEQAIASVTVVAPDGATADGFSTAVAVLGVDKGLALVESLEGVEALILEKKNEGGYAFHESSGMARFFGD